MEREHIFFLLIARCVALCPWWGFVRKTIFDFHCEKIITVFVDQKCFCRSGAMNTATSNVSWMGNEPNLLIRQSLRGNQKAINQSWTCKIGQTNVNEWGFSCDLQFGCGTKFNSCNDLLRSCVGRLDTTLSRHRFAIDDDARCTRPSILHTLIPATILSFLPRSSLSICTGRNNRLQKRAAQISSTWGALFACLRTTRLCRSNQITRVLN